MKTRSTASRTRITAPRRRGEPRALDAIAPLAMAALPLGVMLWVLPETGLGY